VIGIRSRSPIDPRVLARLADEYEEIRATMQPGPQRTSRMSALAATARDQASSVRPPPDLIARWISSARPGLRLIGLAALQSNPDPRQLDVVLDVVREPHAPFEHYQALVVLEGLVPYITDRERERVRSALVRVLDAEHVQSDPSRLQFAQQLLRELDQERP
jgi:hypothetical protein